MRCRHLAVTSKGWYGYGRSKCGRAAWRWLRGHEPRSHCHDTVLCYAVTLQVWTQLKAYCRTQWGRTTRGKLFLAQLLNKVFPFWIPKFVISNKTLFCPAFHWQIYSILHVSSGLKLDLSNSLSLSVLETEVLYALFIYHMRNICRAPPILFDLNKIIFVQNIYMVFFYFCWPCISVYLSQYLTKLIYKICSTISFISCLYMFRAHVLETFCVWSWLNTEINKCMWLFNMHYSQPLFTPSIGQNFLVSKTVANVCPSLNMEDKHSYLYKTVGKVMGFYICIIVLRIKAEELEQKNVNWRLTSKVKKCTLLLATLHPSVSHIRCSI